MKWTAIAISMLVLLLVLVLVSCDQMFSNNLFAGITQQKLSPSSVSTMTPAEIAALTSSTNSMGQLSDPSTKAAALAVLLPAYDTPAEQATASGQTAAIAASDISIKTVPDAAQFASSAISLIPNLSSSTTASSFAASMTSILPADISSQLATSSTPPAAFTAMIDAFSSANGAYQALSTGVAATVPPSYADPTISSSQKTEIAVNATISALICSVVPTSGSTSTAAALWSALQNPSNANSYLSLGSVDAITSVGGSIGGLYTAAGLTAR